MKKIYLIAFAMLSLVGCKPSENATQKQVNTTIFVGTYTEKLGHVDGKASGIYTCKFNTETGQLTIADSTTGIANPSFLCVSPNKEFVYAVAENGGKPEAPYGSVVAYRIQADGHLLKLNEMPSYGVAPCHVSTDLSGKFVLIANYGTGNIATYGIKPDGSITDSLCTIKHPGKEPWAHQILPTPDNSRIWAVDKGADRVFVYQLSPEGKLMQESALTTSPGAGPRHLDFLPQQPAVFALINESNSTLALGKKGSDSRLVLTDSLSTLPADFAGKNSCADVHFHPSGRWVYGSNRGHNSIVGYTVDSVTGKLSAPFYTPTNGATPRNFLITADGKWLLAANQDASTVTVFRINQENGQLTGVGTPVKVPTPVCLKAL